MSLIYTEIILLTVQYSVNVATARIAVRMASSKFHLIFCVKLNLMEPNVYQWTKETRMRFMGLSNTATAANILASGTRTDRGTV
jgi:hypothetical protein